MAMKTPWKTGLPNLLPNLKLPNLLPNLKGLSSMIQVQNQGSPKVWKTSKPTSKPVKWTGMEVAPSPFRGGLNFQTSQPWPKRGINGA
jgi:hypothetical protein